MGSGGNSTARRHGRQHPARIADPFGCRCFCPADRVREHFEPCISKSYGATQGKAIRTALGAVRSRIVQHVLAEALTLSVCGGVLELVIA